MAVPVTDSVAVCNQDDQTTPYYLFISPCRLAGIAIFVDYTDELSDAQPRIFGLHLVPTQYTCPH